MRHTVFGALPWRRALAGSLIAASGLITLVGSGGGLDIDCLFCGPSDPTTTLTVTISSPPVVQVGETASFAALTYGETLYQGQSYTYRWCRSAGEGSPCVEIPGATDHRLLYQVASLADDGNPGAYLRTGFGKPAGAGPWFVLYLSPGAVYDPATQGAIYALGSVMDTLPLSPAPASGERQLWLLAEQGGHWYGQAVALFDASQAGWATVASAAHVYALTAIPFADAAGASCGMPGWPCSPDFSATAAPLRFGVGYVLLNVDDAVAVTSGLDNWKVTVFRR